MTMSTSHSSLSTVLEMKSHLECYLKNFPRIYSRRSTLSEIVWSLDISSTLMLLKIPVKAEWWMSARKALLISHQQNWLLKMQNLTQTSPLFWAIWNQDTQISSMKSMQNIASNWCNKKCVSSLSQWSSTSVTGIITNWNEMSWPHCRKKASS